MLNQQGSALGSACSTWVPVSGVIAIRMTEVLAERSYEGLEIINSAVDWCRENISPVYPNIRLSHLDVLNQCYNPEGRFKASEYQFPFEAAAFDLVILTSVFTRMFPTEYGELPV